MVEQSRSVLTCAGMHSIVHVNASIKPQMIVAKHPRVTIIVSACVWLEDVEFNSSHQHHRAERVLLEALQGLDSFMHSQAPNLRQLALHLEASCT